MRRGDRVIAVGLCNDLLRTVSKTNQLLDVTPRPNIKKRYIWCSVNKADDMPHVLVWDIETVPDLRGFASANGLDDKSDDEVRAGGKAGG